MRKEAFWVLCGALILGSVVMAGLAMKSYSDDFEEPTPEPTATPDPTPEPTPTPPSTECDMIVTDEDGDTHVLC